ncbi:MAG: S8 family serine peptidase [Planctomycetes bacterium]|nr:S8 family serine peptidase [Planctomycetota bacterium]
MRCYTIAGLGLALLLLGWAAASAQPAGAPGERIIPVPGTDTLVKLREAEGVAYAELSRDGGETFVPLATSDTRLMFHYAVHDPLRERPEIPGMLRAGSGSRLHVVQFFTQTLEEYRAGLEALGAEIHHYLAHQAYLVRMDPAVAAAVRALPYVRHVGTYEPAYKLEPALVAMYLAGETPGPRRYNVMLVDPRRDEPALAAAIESVGGRVDTYARGNVLLEATLDENQLLEVLAENTVLWVDRWSPPETDMDNARIQGGANYIEPMKPEQYTGKGVRGMIMEGIYPNHTEFAATPYRGLPIVLHTATSDTHGTATFGVVFARGATAKARGLCPDGQGIYCNYSYVYNNNNRYTLVGELVDPNQQYKGMFQTASWGYARTTIYDSRSAEMDRIIFDWDIPITQSQSNATNQMSRPQAWAKNIISVGATNHYDNSNPADDKWTAGSTGPAADGRVKPDLCAYYDAIYTTYSSTAYGTFGGTSGATPIVCGHLGLLLEMVTDGLFGHPLKPGSSWQNRFENRPHFTTAKALLINTAVPYPNPGRATKHDRFTQGWGFPSLQNAYDWRDRMLVIDELDVLKNLEATKYFVFVPGGYGDLRVTMTFADPENAPVTKIPHRINDLTLSVTGPGVFYWGNQGLAISLSSNYSTTGGAPDTINTVENVFVQDPKPGIYVVEVRASEVNQDTHKETPAVDADFALVVSGITGSRDRSGLELTLSSDSPGDLRLSLAKLPATYSEGWVVYSFDTRRPLGMGRFFGLEPDLLTLQSFFQPRIEGSPFHYARTTRSVFPNTVYTFDPGIAGVLKGITLDGVAFVIDSGGTFLDVSNCARVTVK